MEDNSSNTLNSLLQQSVEKMDELYVLIDQLNTKNYTQPIEVLSQSTVGQHMRHVLEFYICLLDGLEQNEVNYDKRKRDHKLENKPTEACLETINIKMALSRVSSNKMITLKANLSKMENQPASVASSFYRELVYCLEHCIHHQALIKVGLYEMGLLNLIDNHFGVAPSTILNNGVVK